MRVRWLAVLTALLAVAVPVTVAQAGSSTDRATGGGQVLVSSSGKGAGDTIAFTAQDSSEAIKGQLQYVDREGGTGQAQETFHYRVTCIRVEGNVAELGGAERDTGQPFNLVVEDNGQGAMAGNDMIMFDQSVNAPFCGDDESNDEPEVALARGNAQVFDAEE